MVASKAKEPDMGSTIFHDILKDLQNGIEKVNAIRDNNRKCPEESHLSVLADGVNILAWVTVKDKPDDFVEQVLGGARMYGNRILTTYKDK